jgi:hypothetical protein
MTSLINISKIPLVLSHIIRKQSLQKSRPAFSEKNYPTERIFSGFPILTRITISSKDR